jgi:hypothetical protein
MTNFFMRPIEEQTRLRNDHNTAGEVMSNWGPGDLVECDGEFTAIDVLKNSDGVIYQMAGDQWGHVAKINNQEAVKGVWMAIVHMGKPICQIVDAPVPPGPESPFVSARLTRADGSFVDFDVIPKV